MNAIGFEKRIGSLVYFTIFDKHYIYGANTINVYSIDASTTNMGDITDIFDSYDDIHNSICSNSFTDSIAYMLKQEEKAASRKVSEETPLQNSIVSFDETRKLRELTLVITNTCNMACKYCYLSESNVESDHMSEDTARMSIDYLFSHSTESIRISYFGGEPLLNFSVIKASTEYAYRKAIKENRSLAFELVTNGTVMSEEIYEFLGKYAFTIGISLDGPKELHDRFRIYKTGMGTYDSVFKNVELYFSKLPESNSVRFLNILHHDSYSRVNEQYDFFRKFDDEYNISFNRFAKINYLDDREVVGGTIDHIQEYYEMLCIYARKVLDECIEKRSTDPIFKRVRIDGGFLKLLQNKEIVRKNSCSSGVEMFMVYPNGNIAGCRQLDPSIYPNSVWSNINSMGSINELSRLEPFTMCNVANKECSQCWLDTVCKGSCPGMNHHYGDISVPDVISCDLSKVMFKLSIWLKDELTRHHIMI